MDLKIKYKTGREIRKQIDSGASSRVRYESGYETRVVTTTGEMSEMEWINAVEKRIVDRDEVMIFEKLVEYAKTCPWLRTEKELKEYAMNMYVNRIWEDEKWVGYKEFNKVEVKVLTEKVENVNINLITTTTKLIKIEENEQMEKNIIKMDELVRTEMFRVVRKVDESGYMKENRDKETKHEIKINKFDKIRNIYDVVLCDVISGTEILSMQLTKRIKYSVVGEIEILYKSNSETIDEIVAKEVMDHIKNYGEIKKVVVTSKDVIFDVTRNGGIGLDIELSEILYRINRNKDVKLQNIARVLLDRYLEVINVEKNKMIYGDVVTFEEYVSYKKTKGIVKYINTIDDEVVVVIEYIKNGKLIETTRTINKILNVVRVIEKM